MKVLVLILLGMVTVSVTYAESVARTTDGKVYPNCTLLSIHVDSVTMSSDGKVIEIPVDKLLPEDRAKVEPEMKRLRIEALATAARQAEVTRAEEEKQKAPTTPRPPVTTNTGQIYRGVTKIEMDKDGLTVKLSYEGGLARVPFELLTSDWQDKLKPKLTAAKEDLADAKWERQVEEQKTKLRTMSGPVSAKLMGVHKKGVRAVITLQVKVMGKTVTTFPDVILQGLKPGRTTGTWSGIIQPKEVYEDRVKGEILPVFMVH